MISTKQILSYTIGACLLFTLGCKKDKTTKTGIPELTTKVISAVLESTAMSGGTITSDGGEAIAASGICWSKTNTTPTIADDTTKTITASGSFTAMLKNLTPSATYYVRAYATNRSGTGYGNVVTFSTGNGAPLASAVAITGTAKADELLTGNYTYTDTEGEPEAGTIFQWFVANDGTGAGAVAIIGATAKTFRIQEAQQGKYIGFGVTPKSSSGNTTGIQVKSAFIGAVGEGTTVTFTYNGAEVTYGILTSAKTGKKWLDRNLGAGRLATALDDYQAYGDLFQWGRAADGHQIVTRSGAGDGDVIGVNGITSKMPPYETSSIDNPATNKFIINNGDFGSTGDWREPQNSNLWQGSTGINNPCPTGWRMPTRDEWIAESISNGADGFNKLKLTRSGQRSINDGSVIASEVGAYWSSTGEETFSGTFSISSILDVTAFFTEYSYRGNGLVCRCIKN